MIPLACQSSFAAISHHVSFAERTDVSPTIQMMDLVGNWLGHAQSLFSLCEHLPKIRSS
jgi:hypothetical protein